MVKQFFENIRPTYFHNLNFKKPFTEQSFDRRFAHKKVFFTGLKKKQGVFVTRFVDYAGVKRYDITPVEVCLFSAASGQYNLLLGKRATEIEYAFIVTPSKKHDSIVKSLKSGLFHLPLNNHYDLVKDCIRNPKATVPPVEAFNFRRIFLEAPFGGRRFQFTDALNRGGVYIIVKDGVKRVQHIGLSEENLSSVLRNHFYKNDHVDYWKEPHLYSAAVIDMPLVYSRNHESFVKKIKLLETRLIQEYNPVDNKFGKLIKDEVILNEFEHWKGMEGIELF